MSPYAIGSLSQLVELQCFSCIENILSMPTLWDDETRKTNILKHCDWIPCASRQDLRMDGNLAIQREPAALKEVRLQSVLPQEFHQFLPKKHCIKTVYSHVASNGLSEAIFCWSPWCFPSSARSPALALFWAGVFLSWISSDLPDQRGPTNSCQHS